MRRLASILLVLLLAGPSYAATRNKRSVFVNMTGGLNTNSSTLAVPKNELTHATNIDFTTLGARQKRGGSTLYNSVTISGGATITGLYEWEKSDGNRLFFAAADDGKIYKDSGGTFSSVASGYSTSSSVQWTWANWQGTRLIACDGENAAITSTDGTTFTTLTTTPTTCLAPIAHRRRLFIVPVDESVIYYSALNDPTNFTTGDSGSFQVPSSEGGFLTCAASHLGALHIFKERSIHTLYGDSETATDPDPFILKTLNVGVGCVSQNSLKTVTGPEGSDLLFASRFGIVSLKNIAEYGDFRPALISNKISPEWRKLNSTRLGLSSSVFYQRKGEYWFAAAKSGSSSNDIILKYTVLNRAWSVVHLPMAVNVLANKRDNTTKDLLVYVGDEDGYVWKLDDGSFNDNNAAYEGFYKTPWLDLGRPDIKKSFGPKLIVYTEASGDYNLVISYAIDFATEKYISTSLVGGCVALGTFRISEDRLCAAQDITKVVAPVSIRGEGTWIRLGFSNSNADEKFVVYGFTLEYSEMED